GRAEPRVVPASEGLQRGLVSGGRGDRGGVRRRTASPQSGPAGLPWNGPAGAVREHRPGRERAEGRSVPRGRSCRREAREPGAPRAAGRPVAAPGRGRARDRDGKGGGARVRGVLGPADGRPRESVPRHPLPAGSGDARAPLRAARRVQPLGRRGGAEVRHHPEERTVPDRGIRHRDRDAGASRRARLRGRHAGAGAGGGARVPGPRRHRAGHAAPGAPPAISPRPVAGAGALARRPGDRTHRGGGAQGRGVRRGHAPVDGPDRDRCARFRGGTGGAGESHVLGSPGAAARGDGGGSDRASVRGLSRIPAAVPRVRGPAAPGEGGCSRGTGRGPRRTGERHPGSGVRDGRPGGSRVGMLRGRSDPVGRGGLARGPQGHAGAPGDLRIARIRLPLPRLGVVRVVPAARAVHPVHGRRGGLPLFAHPERLRRSAHADPEDRLRGGVRHLRGAAGGAAGRAACPGGEAGVRVRRGAGGGAFAGLRGGLRHPQRGAQRRRGARPQDEGRGAHAAADHLRLATGQERLHLPHAKGEGGLPRTARGGGAAPDRAEERRGRTEAAGDPVDQPFFPVRPRFRAGELLRRAGGRAGRRRRHPGDAGRRARGEPAGPRRGELRPGARHLLEEPAPGPPPARSHYDLPRRSRL
ncbi:MAG: hypothetical protein AVDCRST_MAG68-1679, partial [uncultured Gemmatimonadetes bacterium]